jgi:hypothetical protein
VPSETGHHKLSPADIGSAEAARTNADEYLFFDAIKFIFQVDPCLLSIL